MEVDRTVERQIFELTNIYRENMVVLNFQMIMHLTVLAREHSEDMALENYFLMNRL